MYQHILVPVDGSKTSQASLLEVANFARLCPGAVIRLVHVVDLIQATSSITEFASSAIPLTKLEDDIRKEGQEILDRALATAKEAGFTPEAALLESYGKPTPEMILEAAETWSADIIIMGTHGYSGLTHLLLGSVTDGVIRHSTVPILLVRGKG